MSKYRSIECTYEGPYLEITLLWGDHGRLSIEDGSRVHVEYIGHGGAVETEAWCIRHSHWYSLGGCGREIPSRVAWVGPISHQREEPKRQIVFCLDGIF